MSIAQSIRKFLTSHYMVSLLLLWSSLIIVSVSWNLYQTHQDTIAKARIEARTIYRHNIAYRKWSTMHGGIYTKITDKNKDNPHFMLNMEGGQGISFAMIDPSQVTKQAYDVLHKQSPNLAAISHTVSLDSANTVDPYDDPDKWEKDGLLAFQDGGVEEFSIATTINNAPYLRLLKPYVIDQGCIKCHEQQDYKIGHVRGGMSVAIPLQPYYETAVKTKRTIFLTHMLLWLLGCLAIIKFSAAFKKYRTTIMESEEKFRIVSEFAYNFEYWINQKNNLTFISPSCERLTGYSRQEFMDNPKLLLDIIHPGDIDHYRNHLTVIDAPEHEGTDFRIKRKDGEIRWFTHTCSPIYINGEFLGRRGSSIDVTEHKNLEDRLLRAKQLECLGQFAGGIAHDFNNVLSSINTFTHLLNDELKGSSKTAADYVKYIKIAAKLGKNLTSNLLSFGKKQIVKPQRTNLKTIIGNIADILKNLVDEEINYVFKLSDVDLEISADPHQIEQILINLCTNSRDAMKDGGKITIATEIKEITETYKGILEEVPAGKYMVLSVSDTGKGIAPEHVTKICEPFFTTKSSSKGTGLGLSIIHTIIKQHNAFLDMESTLDEGTCFSIYIPGGKPAKSSIPLTPASEKTKSVPEKITKKGPKVILKAGSSIGQKTILLADDDELVRKSLSIPLEKTGYNVILAEDGKKAISTFLDKQESIDLIILDVVLPHRNGKEVYDIIRKNNSSIDVIFISGYTDNIITESLLQNEHVHFFTKPIEIETFLEKIHSLTDT